MPEPVKTALSLAAALLFLWSAVWCIRRVFSPEPAPHYTEPSSRSRCWAAIAGAAFILVLHLIFAVTAHINYPGCFTFYAPHDAKAAIKMFAQKGNSSIDEFPFCS